jgi:CubicO group peptidase (beta-lactamase class C family)
MQSIPTRGNTPLFDRRTFLKQLGVGAAGLGVILGSPECLAAARHVRNPLPRSTPEAQGISSAGILSFLEALARSTHEFHSFLLVRHGKAVAEGWWRPYRPEAPQMLYSLSKSFTSTALGFAVAEHQLSVDDRVISFFPDELPQTVSDNLRALRIRDLLSMSVGHAQDSTGSLWAEQDWVRKFLSLEIANPPGTAFLYNSGATYMVSAIVQRVTGQRLIDYLRPRLFEPLGIAGCTWESCPRGINTGGWGLKIQTEGLAKFGHLYLSKGLWNGKRILPAAWIEEATSFKIQQPAPDLERAKQQSDWHQGYGYQFWRCRHNAYRGDGAFGQYTIVMPQQNAVIAITSESPNMQSELDLIWEHLFPAMKDCPLPANRSSQHELSDRLRALEVPPLKGQPTSACVARFSGKRFDVETDPRNTRAVSFEFTPKACRFSLEDDQGTYSVRCGIEQWLDGETAMPGTPPKLTQGKLPPVSKVSASATWKDESTFQMRWQYYETPHHDAVSCHFEADKVRIEFLDSLTAMSPGRKDKRPPVEGRLAR